MDYLFAEHGIETVSHNNGNGLKFDFNDKTFIYYPKGNRLLITNDNQWFSSARKEIEKMLLYLCKCGNEKKDYQYVCSECY